MDLLDVWLTDYDPEALPTITADLVRAFGIEAHVARALVASVPRSVKRGVPPVIADRYRRALEKAGGIVALIPHGRRPERRSVAPLSSMPPPRESFLEEPPLRAPSPPVPSLGPDRGEP